MSKVEIYIELQETISAIEKMVNSNGVINLDRLNYEIYWASKYSTMLMEK